MYRIINNTCPDYLKKMSHTSDISCRDTSSTKFNQLYTPKPNCELFHKSFMYSHYTLYETKPRVHLLFVRIKSASNGRKSTLWKKKTGI